MALISLIINQLHYGVCWVCCQRGKHRSVAWAEILKRDHYPHATIKHVRLAALDPLAAAANAERAARKGLVDLL